jgi:hypothetical protein
MSVQRWIRADKSAGQCGVDDIIESDAIRRGELPPIAKRHTDLFISTDCVDIMAPQVNHWREVTQRTVMRIGI